MMAQGEEKRMERWTDQGRENNKTSLAYRARMVRYGRICPNNMPNKAV